ncbi:nucleoporin Nup120/160-domain-containing protein [Powellomyces hirtus]|nr:nucleoporin Nup120/160-domain-containing protein [Powellomyces hirtus]
MRPCAATSFPLDTTHNRLAISQCAVVAGLDTKRILTDDLAPAGGVTHLAGCSSTKSFVVWRLLGHRHVLELRRIFMASAPAAPGSAMLVEDDVLPDPKFSNTPVHIYLPAAVLQTPSISLDADGRTLHVMLVTSAGTFFRIIFEGPNFFYDDGWRRRKIHRYQIRALMHNRPDGRTNKPALVQFPNINTIIVGCSNGTVVKVAYVKRSQQDEDDYLSDEQDASTSAYKEVEFADGNVIDQLKSALTPMKQWFSPFKGAARTVPKDDIESPRQPIAMNSVRHFGFVLCRDRQVRVWNLRNGSKWKTVNVSADYSQFTEDGMALSGGNSALPLADSKTGHFIQIFDEQPYDIGEDFDESGLDFKAAIHVPPAHGQNGCFAIYRGRMDRYGDMQEFDIESFEDGFGAGEVLIDFMVIPRLTAGSATNDGWVLWALWRQSDGVAVARHADIRNLDLSSQTRAGNTQWTALIHERMPSPPNVNDLVQGETVADLYLQYINHPGRFSNETKLAALASYKDTSGAMFLDSVGRISDISPKASLTDDITDAVLSAVDQRNPESEEEEWSKFLQTCVNFHIHNSSPAAIDWDASYNSILITNREFLTAVRECETVEILQNMHDHRADVPPPLSFYTHASIPHFGDSGIKAHFLTFLFLADWVSARLPGENLVVLEKQVKNVIFESTPAEFLEFAKTVASEIFTFGSAAAGEDPFSEFTTRFLQIPQTFFERFLKVLTSADQDLAQLQQQSPNTSAFTNYLVAQAFAQTTNERYRLMNDLFVVLLFANRVLANEDHQHVNAQLLVQAAEAMRPLLIGKWIAGQNVTLKQTGSKGKGASPQQLYPSPNQSPHGVLTGRMKDLKLSGPADQNGITEQSDITEPLAFHLLQQHYLLEIDFADDSNGAYSALVKAGVGIFTSRLGLFVKSDASATTTSTLPLLKLVSKLLAFQHLDAAKHLVKMLPNCPAVFYLRGRVAAEFADWKAAEAEFDRAAVDFGKKGLLPNATLTQVLPVDVITGGSTAYEQHLMHLFSRKNCSRLVVKYSKQALTSLEHEAASSADNTKLIAKLYNENFRHNLAIPDYDAAYASVVLNPDRQIQINCLRLLVGTMCEQNHIEGICGQFAFDALQEEVELELVNKIRTTHVADCLDKGPNYYRIYHAYSVSRNDYRTAASTMYIYANKINTELLSRASNRATRNAIRPIEALQEQCAAYLAALNALLSIDEEYAYILVPGSQQQSPDANGGTLRRKRRRLDNLPGWDNETTGLVPRRNTDQQQPELIVIRSGDIRKEYLLSLAKLNLYNLNSTATIAASNASVNHNLLNMTPTDALTLYVAANRFDDALSLGVAFGLDLTRVFESMAEKCVWLAKRSTTSTTSGNTNTIHSTTTENEEYLTDDPYLAWNGTDAQRAWRLLCKYVDELDKEPSTTYRIKVVERVLYVDPRHPLPLALTGYYKNHHPEDLLRLYLRYGLVEDAARFFSDYLQSEHDHRAQQTRATMPARWIPYTLIDQTLARLEVAASTATSHTTTNLATSTSTAPSPSSTSATAAALRQVLEQRVKQYLESVTNDSEKALRSSGNSISNAQGWGAQGRTGMNATSLVPSNSLFA